MSDILKNKFKRKFFSVFIFLKRILLKIIKSFFFFRGASTNFQPKTILILKVGGLGDFLFGIPALNLLRKMFPHARIILVTAKSLSELGFNSLNRDPTDTKRLPWLNLARNSVDDILVINDLSYKTIIKTSRLISKEGELGVFILGYPGMTIPSAIKKMLLIRMLVKGFVTCVGVDKKLDDICMRKFQAQHNMYRHKMLGDIDSVLEVVPNNSFDENDLDFNVTINPLIKTQITQKLTLSVNDVLVLIAPVATRIHKQWPLENFVQITRDLRKVNANCKFILIGTEDNYAEVEKFYHNIDFDVNNLCGHLSIEELAGLFSIAKGYIGNDGGMSQLAGMMGCPSVIVFNSVEEDWITHPWRSKNGVVRNRTACSPCFNAITCPAGHRKCVIDIPINAVLKKANDIFFNVGV